MRTTLRSELDARSDLPSRTRADSDSIREFVRHCWAVSVVVANGAGTTVGPAHL